MTTHADPTARHLGDADIAALGSVLAEPARARMLMALGDGRALAASVLASEAGVGGGAFPIARIPSFAVSPAGPAARLERALREAPTPVIGRATDDRVLLDLRSVAPDEDALLVESVAAAVALVAG